METLIIYKLTMY